MADPLRLALDRNFPLSVLKMAPALPEVELVPIRLIDRRLGELDDRSLVIALCQLGWVGLVTNNPARTAGFLVNTSLHAHVNLVFGPRPAGTETGRAGTLWLMNRRE